MHIRNLKFAGFETGFRNVLAFEAAPAEFLAARQDLTCFGVHIFLPDYDPETKLPPAELVLHVANTAAALGAERLIVSGAPAVHGRGSASALTRKAQALNEIGSRTLDLGLKLAYHNHAPELAGSPSELEHLLQSTDPHVVSLVLDAGHGFRAGTDLVSFIQEHSQRIEGVHLRDFKDGVQVPLGAGDFPLRAVANTLIHLQWNGWVLIEEERENGSKPGIEAVQPARAALRAAFDI